MITKACEPYLAAPLGAKKIFGATTYVIFQFLLALVLALVRGMDVIMDVITETSIAVSSYVKLSGLGVGSDAQRHSGFRNI